MVITNRSNAQDQSAQDLVSANIIFLMEQLRGGRSEVLIQYLSAMARFHTYSFGNVLLLARQKPDATHVAGIRTWNQLGRRVKGGEKGIMILAPMVGKRSKRASLTTGEKGRGGEADDARSMERREGVPRLRGFRPAYVWDISQTEGRDLPEPQRVKGESGRYLDRLAQFVLSLDIELEYSEDIAPARGVSYGGKIRVLAGLDEGERFSVLVHELAHELLHKTERRAATTKTIRETEAEAIAFVVSSAIGLQTGTSASDYIQLYHGNAQLLQESLEFVQRTSAVILGAIRFESPRTVNGAWVETAGRARQV
jgi:hypothetical protein